MFTCPLLEKLNQKCPIKKIDQTILTICYKLLHDSLLVFLIFFTLALIAEAILPGIIISHIGFSKIIFILLFNILLIKLLATKIISTEADQKISFKKIIIPFSLLGALLILNGQMSMNIFLSLFLLFICAIIFYLSYQVLKEH